MGDAGTLGDAGLVKRASAFADIAD